MRFILYGEHIFVTMTETGSKKDGKSNRFCPTFTKLCILEVEAHIEYYGIYNGKSDFLSSALRSFIIKFNNLYTDTEKKCKSMFNDGPESEILLRASMNELGSKMKEVYSKKYPGSNGPQINIYLSNDFSEFLHKIGNICNIDPRDIARYAVYERLISDIYEYNPKLSIMGEKDSADRLLMDNISNEKELINVMKMLFAHHLNSKMDQD